MACWVHGVSFFPEGLQAIGHAVEVSCGDGVVEEPSGRRNRKVRLPHYRVDGETKYPLISFQFEKVAVGQTEFAGLVRNAPSFG